MSEKGDMTAAQVSRELALGELVQWLFLQWRVIAAVTLLGVLLAVWYALAARVLYRSDIVLVQVTKPSMSGAVSQLSGLAQIAGLDIGGDADSQAGMAVLRSRSLAQAFIEDKSLQQKIAAASSSRFGSGSRGEMDIRDAVKVFDDDIRSVAVDRKSGLVTLGITWVDPAEAANWANELVDLTNSRLRDEAITAAERNIAYLQKEIAATAVLPLQQSLSRTLEVELQKLLLARGNNEFAFRVIDRAVAPRTKVSPRRQLVVATGAVAGFMAGVFLALIIQLVRKVRGAS